MRHHVRLNLAHEVHRHDHHDQQRSAAEVEGDIELEVEELRDETHKDEISRTAERKTQEHAVDVTRRLLTRTNARNEGTALLQILSRFLRVEDQRRIEEGKENDERCVEERVKRLTG